MECAHLIQRKKRAHEDDGEGKGSKQMEEKLKKIRKRNADLVALAKQLDEKCKSLRIENEQLVSCMISGSYILLSLLSSSLPSHTRHSLHTHTCTRKCTYTHTHACTYTFPLAPIASV